VPRAQGDDIGTTTVMRTTTPPPAGCSKHPE